jgi:hypothetical protein
MRLFKFQIGQFFLVIGVFMLAVFFVTDQSRSPQFLLFFGGVLVIAVGISIMMRNREPPTGESARFRRVRQYRQKSRERQEKKRRELQARREGGRPPENPENPERQP